MTEKKQIRILIADDHPIVLEGWSSMINRAPDMTVVGEARSGMDAVRLYEQLRPDVALIDLRMPEMDGVTAIEEIRQYDPDARILVLTTFDGEEDIYRALKAGAMAYILKDTDRTKLMEAIHNVYQNKKMITPDVALKLLERVSADALSERELDVLRLIADGKSNRDIGLVLHITEGTVKAHVNRITGKLGATDRTHAVTLALQRGILRLP